MTAAPGINVEGVRVTDMNGALAGGVADEMLIVPLHDALLALAPARIDTTAGLAGTIQSDRRIDFALLKRVLYTCNQAGYDDLSLLVLREAS